MKFESAIRGLVMGDSLSTQNATHRLALLSERRVRRFNILQAFATENKHTTVPEPYVHGFSPKYLYPRPSDDVEWFFWSRDVALSQSEFSEKWQEMAALRGTLRIRVSVASALQNISMGMRAPSCGHDNPHYFDNSAMFRALGIFSAMPRDINRLKELIKEDATHTNSEDGVWCAVAIGVLAARIDAGTPISEAIDIAIDELPQDSWSRREVLRALALSKSESILKERVMLLEEKFVDRIYPYPYAAPETLGLLMSHLLHKEDPYLMFTSSFLHRRNTDSIPGLIGYFLGLQHGDSWMPQTFRTENVFLDGVSIPDLKGTAIFSE